MKKLKKEEKVIRKRRFKIKRRQPNRSVWGDIFLYLFLAMMAVIMVFPLVFAINNALKPLDE